MNDSADGAVLFDGALFGGATGGATGVVAGATAAHATSAAVIGISASRATRRTTRIRDALFHGCSVYAARGRSKVADVAAEVGLRRPLPPGVFWNAVFTAPSDARQNASRRPSAFGATSGPDANSLVLVTREPSVQP